MMTWRWHAVSESGRRQQCVNCDQRWRAGASIGPSDSQCPEGVPDVRVTPPTGGDQTPMKHRLPWLLEAAHDELTIATEHLGMAWDDYVDDAWLKRNLRQLATVWAHDSRLLEALCEAFDDEVIRQHQTPTHCRGQRRLQVI